MSERDGAKRARAALTAGLEAFAAVALQDPALQVVGAASAPIVVHMFDRSADVLDRWLSKREAERIQAVLTYAAAELARRWERGDRPRVDLFDTPYRRAEELIEGTLVKAQREYESRKHAHLGFFMIEVLFDESRNLGDAFHELDMASRLTYEQYVLLGLFWKRTRSPQQAPAVSAATLLEMTSSDTSLALAMSLNDLFTFGLLSEVDGEEIHKPSGLGGFVSRYGGGNPVQGVKPAHIQLSGAGEGMVKSLNLASVPNDELRRVAERLT